MVNLIEIFLLKFQDMLVVQFFGSFNFFVGNDFKNFSNKFGLLIFEFNHIVGDQNILERDNIHEDFI